MFFANYLPEKSESFFLFIVMYIDNECTFTHFWKPEAASREKLQTDINIVFNWEAENNMIFNIDNFQLFRYGKNKNLKEIQVRRHISS